MNVSGKENGKPNIHYSNSTGVMKMSCNGRSISPGLSKGSVIMPNNKAIGCTNEMGNTCIPFTRINCSVDANGTMQTIMSEGSSTDLVIDGNRKRKLCCRNCSSKTVLWTVLVLFSTVIVCLAALYIKEVNKANGMIKVLEQGATCFKRATPKEIANITKEVEIFKAIEDCNKRIKQKITEGTYHAVSLSVSYMGQMIWSYTHGRLNYSAPQSHYVTIDTPYPIASISKVFTVIMLHKFIDKHWIKSIDDDIRKYQPSFVIENPFNNNNITFRQLACMMSGLPREAPCYSAKLENSSVPRKNKFNMCPFNSTYMMKMLRNISLIVRPGTEPSYSNLALGILGDVLGRILRILHNGTLENWVKVNIIEPLEMTNTGYITLENKKDLPLSSLYAVEAPIMDWGWLRSAAGMYSSINDLGKLGAFFFEGFKSILSKAQMDGILKPAYIWSDGYSQGCPFEVQPMYMDKKAKKYNQMSYISYEKGGYIFGYGSLFKLIPAIKLNMNCLVAAPGENAAEQLHTIVSRQFTHAFDKLLKRKGTKYKLPPQADAYVGSYKLLTYWPLINRPCNITLENNRLLLQIEWLTTPLSHKGGWILTSGDFNQLFQRCVFAGSGLMRDEYVFTPPKDGKNKSSGFFVNSISSSGYLKFTRI